MNSRGDNYNSSSTFDESQDSDILSNTSGNELENLFNSDVKGDFSKYIGEMYDFNLRSMSFN